MRKSPTFTVTALAVLLAVTFFVVLPARPVSVSAEAAGPAHSDNAISGPPVLAVDPPTPEEPVQSTPTPPAESEVTPSPGGTETESEAPEAIQPQPPEPPASAPVVSEPIYRLPRDRRDIVLTFDDGPGRYTRSVLEILAAEEVPAAFFWVAGLHGLEMAPELLAQGHQLGTHSMSHADLTKLDSLGQQDEIAGSSAALAAAAQAEINYFRPPYGAWNDDTLQIAAEHGLSAVLWDVDSRDWALANDPDQIITNVLQEVQEGSIILLHERPQTVQVLPQLIRALRAQGYSFSLLP